MLHAKIMVVDSLWGVVGSTNFDNRSFGLNNEVNLVLRDPGFAAGAQQVIDGYLQRSRLVTLEDALHRPLLERVLAELASIVERQE